jgi:hypothetical protein
MLARAYLWSLFYAWHICKNFGLNIDIFLSLVFKYFINFIIYAMLDGGVAVKYK